MMWLLRDDGNQSIVGEFTFQDFGDENRAAIVGRRLCDQDKPIKITRHEYAILREEHAKRIAELRGYLATS